MASSHNPGPSPEENAGIRFLQLLAYLLSDDSLPDQSLAEVEELTAPVNSPPPSAPKGDK